MNCAKMNVEIDPRTGIGLRAQHVDALLSAQTPLSWVEVHSENWLAETGPIAERMADIRRRFDISLHGVGLSLGSADGLDMVHLRRLNALIDRCNPILVSEHLCWGRVGGKHSNDLLPIPYDRPNARLFIERIDQVQQFLGRRILVENVSSYCTFAASTMPEWEFVSEVVDRAQCGLLLDINNVYVNAVNHGFDAVAYLRAMPWDRVKEVHLAGYDSWGDVLIDTHGRPVQAPVWGLFDHFSKLLGDESRVLIEWDADLPALEVLLAEAAKASRIRDTNSCKEVAGAGA